MRVIVTGAGMGGLCTAMVLARDGHDVTVVERDPQDPPDPADAWQSWNRRGVNQARLPHLFLSRFRSVVETELPDLGPALVAAGALRFDVLGQIPDQIKGGTRLGDDDYVMLTGRRLVVEAVTARLAANTPGLRVRRGVAVSGLETGPTTGARVPHVTGARLDNGERIMADLVVDATGRRSPLPDWLGEIGAAPIEEEIEDSGFFYFGRHFRSDDGSMPPMIGPLQQRYGSVTALTLPADNGTWSVTIVTSGSDGALRRLRDAQRWAATLRLLPLAAHWIDAEPIDSGVTTMAKIEDRVRHLAPGGLPVATGVVAVADSWACTNPSLGRGATLGLLHALALRDLLRTSAIDDPSSLVRGWHDATLRSVDPWYRSTVSGDRHRLHEVEAEIAGQRYASIDPAWDFEQALGAAAGQDPDCFRALLDIAMVRRLPEEVAADPSVASTVAALGDTWRDEPLFGPSRAELLATAAG